MALGSTVHRFAIQLSDVDRGVYETLDLRVARHPSESDRRMVARVLAYALRHEDGIAFGRGLSTAEEPAVWVKNLRGEIEAWVDVGLPSADRLHRASKSGARVYVYTHRDATPWLPGIKKANVHNRERIEVWALPGGLLDALEARVSRSMSWTLTVNDGQIYVEDGRDSVEGTPERLLLE